MFFLLISTSPPEISSKLVATVGTLRLAGPRASSHLCISFLALESTLGAQVFICRPSSLRSGGQLLLQLPL